MTDYTFRTTCCVVGGGPAGIMLGYLLARTGVPVTVLEKHNDFFRDFRGDTVHPSTLELFHELGLLEEFLQVPHQKLTAVHGVFGDFAFRAADFTHVPARNKFVALMPQWDFLNFLVRKAARHPEFDIRMNHEAEGLISDGGRVAGVEAKTPEGTTSRIQADLVVGCDGRHSTIRNAARLELMEFGVPIDVLWFRISRQPGDPEQLLGNLNYGKGLVMVNRGDYFQAGLIIRKGSFEEVKQRGMDEFRQGLLQIAPYLGDRVSEVRDWEQISLLTVQINRLRQWSRPGLLLIGDAAHAMSPAGGVGINLAIQDAVAAARLLAQPLLERRVTEDALLRVQQRREFPTRVTQWLQSNIHNAMAARVFQNPGPLQAPWQLKLVTTIPGVPHLAGRIVGMGIRPEHIGGAPRPAPRPRKLRVLAICAGIAWGIGVTALRLRRGRQASPAPVL